MEDKIKDNVAKEKSELDILNEKIEKLNSEVNDWKKAYAIKLADFENYKNE